MTPTKERREWRMTNAAAIAAGARWYPFAESGAPTDKEYEEQFPLRSYSLDNTSDNSTTLVLDPAPLSSGKQWDVAANKSRESDVVDRLTFHSMHVVNNGVDQIAIGELKAVVRNY